MSELEESLKSRAAWGFCVGQTKAEAEVVVRCFFDLGRERLRFGVSMFVASSLVEAAGLALPMREGHAAEKKEKTRQSSHRNMV